MEPDERFPIAWDISANVEGKLAEQLCCDFEAVHLDCAAKLKAADLASKIYHDHTMPLLSVTFAEGEIFYHHYHRIGKLLLHIEGLYDIHCYANVLRTSAVVCDPHM